MTNTDVISADPTISQAANAPTQAFGALSASDSNGDDNSPETGDNRAKKAFLSTMRELGRAEAKGDISRLDAILAPMDAIFDGSISFTEKRKGPPKKGAVAAADDVAEGFEAYRDANAKAGKQMTSPSQQLSKFRAAARWAAGPASWNVKETRDLALEKHKEIHLANNEKKTKKEGKQNIYAPSQVIINLAHAQCADARMADPAVKDQPLSEDEVLACIYKPERQEKEFVEWLEAASDKCNSHAENVGDDKEGELVAVLAGSIDTLKTYIKERAKAAQEAEENLQAYQLLVSRGIDLTQPLRIGGMLPR